MNASPAPVVSTTSVGDRGLLEPVGAVGREWRRPHRASRRRCRAPAASAERAQPRASPRSPTEPNATSSAVNPEATAQSWLTTGPRPEPPRLVAGRSGPAKRSRVATLLAARGSIPTCTQRALARSFEVRVAREVVCGHAELLALEHAVAAVDADRRDSRGPRHGDEAHGVDPGAVQSAGDDAAVGVCARRRRSTRPRGRGRRAARRRCRRCRLRIALTRRRRSGRSCCRRPLRSRSRRPRPTAQRRRPR